MIFLIIFQTPRVEEVVHVNFFRVDKQFKASGAKIVTLRQPILNNINNPGLHRNLHTEFVERDSTSVKKNISRTVSTSVKDKQITFQLPASRITPRSAQADINKHQRLLDTYNRDRGLQVLPKYNLKHNMTQIDSRIIETSKSAKKKENKKFITVTVPQPEQLGVKCPVWYPQSSGHGSNNTEIQKSANVESSSSGVKNLLSEFNDANEDQIEKDPSDDYILNPENQVYENVVSDEEVDEEAAHRGEYLSDAEADKEPQLPGRVTIANLPSSKIFINLPHEDVFMMRNRLVDQGHLHINDQ
ncbi:hypothetical protein POM88_006230 [Heracleum sosnowskyi]|uniref:Uncharacterized protein n=1 Tax=Heracleum sosnowskyi TaxID=360622 RepID=A0AAD8J2A0_9APIA|nr:hypothetical protein POM88_006230 [Heracleum sosnowskyi]